jgi:capsular polysaccharide transport system permease protein
MRPLAPATVVQGRILTAVVLREMHTRFGRTRLGYLWALTEPLAHVLTLLALFSLLGRSSPIGDDLLPFFTTGIVPWLVFSHTAARVMKAVDANQALLSYPHVTPLDLMAARAVLETATLAVVFAVLLAALGLLGSEALPHNLLDMAGGFACMAVFGTGIGMAMGGLLTVLPSADRVYSAATRPLYFVSGIFFTTEALPQAARDWLLVNPILHMVEWVRSGFFGQYESTHLDRPYAVACAAAVLFLGLAAERVSRARARQA